VGSGVSPFSSQTDIPSPGANPVQADPGILDAINRELGGAFSNMTDPAWLNRQVGGAMSSVGDAALAVKEALTPSRESIGTLGNVLLGMAAGYNNPLGLLQLGQNRDLMQLKQQQFMLDQQQLQEQQRQHNLQLIERIMTSDQQAGVKAKMLEQTGIPQGVALSKVLKEADYQSFNAYLSYIPEEVKQRFIAGKLDPLELSEWVARAREMYKADVKHRVEQQAFDSASAAVKAGTATSSQAKMVQDAELQAKKVISEITKNEAQAVKASRDPKDTPDRSLINRVTQERTGGRSWDDVVASGDTALMKEILDEATARYSQGRMQVQMGTPASVKERSDMFTVKGLKSLDLERAPAGISEGDLRRGEYVEVSEKDQRAVSEFKVAKKTVDTMYRVADTLITAKTTTEAAKQFASLWAGAVSKRNPLAAAYLADLSSFSSRMARLVEVGVLTNTDVTRWENTFPSFGDTRDTMKAKHALFVEIQDETERAMISRLTGKPIEQHRSKLDELLEKAGKFDSPRTQPAEQRMSPEEIQRTFKSLPPLGK
jgi:hypothetical protein